MLGSLYDIVDFYLFALWAYMHPFRYVTIFFYSNLFILGSLYDIVDFYLFALWAYASFLACDNILLFKFIHT